jgi:hypothetical protein
MKVEQMDFTFDFKNRKISASCTKFKTAEKMMYRVFIPGKTIDYDEVYIFYENKKRKKLEWYSLPDKNKEEKAKVIAAIIESTIFLPN